MSFDIGHTTWHLAKGEALRPDAFPPSEIESLRQNHQGSPFRLYYQQGRGPRKDDFQIDVSHFPFVSERGWGNAASGAHVVLSVDPAQKSESSSRNVIHVYAVRGNQYEFLQAFAEKCSFKRLARKIRVYATRYRASLILIENTARGPDLVETLGHDIGIPIIAVTPQGSKASRLRKCVPIIRAKRVRVKNRAEVEDAVDEILAYPNGAYDDHVDALTNFLLEAAKFTPLTFSQAWPAQPTKTFLVRSRPAYTVPAPTRTVPAARPPSEPIYSFDGEKMVRVYPRSA
jgi:predicted phage terminase large subunit-like protein